MQDFTKLRVWQLSHEFAVETARVLRSARRGHSATVAQLRESTASIPANISEGAGQSTQPKFANFLTIAIGSTTESHNHLLYLRDTGAIDPHIANGLITRLEHFRPMLIRLHQRVSAGTPRKPTTHHTAPTTAANRSASPPRIPHAQPTTHDP
jgi:four helix bundle protein